MSDVEVNVDHVQQSITNAQQNLGPLIEDVLQDLGKWFLRQVQTNLSGRVLKKQTGRLYDSWGYKIEPIGANKIMLTVGCINDNVPYAEIQDKGGITGRNHATKIPASLYYSSVDYDAEAKIDWIIGNKLKKMFK